MGLFDIFSNDDQQKAANDQIGGITRGLNDLTSSLSQGRDAINTNYAQALQPLAQNFNTATAGQNELADLLGFGKGGTGNIQDVLSKIPGYQFALDQGNQNVLRNQAATGQLNSGATNIDLEKFGQGLADQNYFNFVQALQPQVGAAGQAASGEATVKTGQGNQLNQNLVNLGNAQYGAATSQGNAQANADLANLTASQNMWGGLLGGASMFLGL